jgi:hypothetical protein
MRVLPKFHVSCRLLNRYRPVAGSGSLIGLLNIGRPIYRHLSICVPIAVVVRSKASVCGRSLAGIAGSNPTGGMDVCLL